MNRYRVRYDRKGGWWIATVPGVQGCRSDGRTLDEARRRIREALGLFVDDAETAEFEEDVRLPATARRAIQAQRKAREAAEETQLRASVLAREAAAVLTQEVGLSRRDAGALLGLSHQRVQQILSDKAD